MKILCLLDSVHYTDPEYIRVNDNVPALDIKEYAKERMLEYVEAEIGRKDPSQKIEWEGDERADLRAGEDYFVVCEIKSIPDAKCITGYNHAYDGVGFKVKGFDSIEEARAFATKKADELAGQVKIVEDNRDINSITLDDDNEWHHWESQLISETTIKSGKTAA